MLKLIEIILYIINIYRERERVATSLNMSDYNPSRTWNHNTDLWGTKDRPLRRSCLLSDEGLAEFGHSISLDLCNQRPLAVDELCLAEGMTCFATSFGQQGSLVISLASVIIHNGARWREGERERGVHECTISCLVVYRNSCIQSKCPNSA